MSKTQPSLRDFVPLSNPNPRFKPWASVVCPFGTRKPDVDLTRSKLICVSPALEEVNLRLKRCVGDLTVQNQILKEVNAKKW